MARIDPDEAAAIANGRWAVKRPASPLTSFAIDTRSLQSGETFVALRTDRADGHDFLDKAHAYHALAALVERPNLNLPIPQLVVEDSLRALQTLSRSWRSHFTAPVIGITGSYGKTTVKEMLGKVLGSQWFRTRGNYNNHIGVPLSLLEMDPYHHAGAILEAGINDVGEMDFLAGLIRPDMAIVTAVGPAHLERLGGLEGVAAEKAILAKAVQPGGDVFIPASLLAYPAFREIPPEVQVHALLCEGEAADPVWQDLPNVSIYHYKWTEMTDSRGMGELLTRPPMLPGIFTFRAASPGMVSNLSLVVAVALHLGVPLTTIQACLDAWRPIRQRGEMVRHGETHFYVDCYNANPGSMLDSARRFANLYPDQPHLYVIGSMNELGEQAAFWHRQTALGLPLQNGAEIHLIGAMAPYFAEGLRSRGIPSRLIHLVEDLDQLRERLAHFEGAVFLKGSRSLGLESLLPAGGPSC